MDPNASSTSSSSSSSEDSNKSGSGESKSSTHTSPDREIKISQEPPSRSVFSLERRALSMKNVASTPELIFPVKNSLKGVDSLQIKDIDITSPDLPDKGPFKDSVEGDDAMLKKMKLEDGKAPQICNLEDGGDDIAILKGILEYYYSQNGDYPFDNLSDLHDFIKGLVQGDFNPGKLGEEIFRLREKYMKIQGKEGGELDQLGSHEREAFELSKKIWSKNADDDDESESDEDNE